MMHQHIDSYDDATLVAMVREGLRDAFTPLLLRHFESVVRLCHRLLGPVEAQDVAQEAALQAFLGLRSLHEPARFGAWLHAIAANLARMALRRRPALSLDRLGELAPVVLWPQPPAGLEATYEAREVHDAIVAALGELSPANRDVAIGYFLEGYSYAELAELLGVPVSTIKGRLFKGRRQLQRTLAPVAYETLKPDRRPQKEQGMETPELIEVKVDSIRQSLLTKHRVVVLQEIAGPRALPIWIGVPEGEAIKRALEGAQTERPMTHDLSLRMLEQLGAQVTRVVINKIVNYTFFAEVELSLNGQSHSVDARPSDALALAVRSNVPVYAERTVLEIAYEAALAPSITNPAPVAEEELSPAFEATWEYLLALANFQAGPPVEDLTENDWAERFPMQPGTWEGEPVRAVRLPLEAPGWLLLPPGVWGEVDQTARRWLANMEQIRQRRAEWAAVHEANPQEPAAQ